MKSINSFSSFRKVLDGFSLLDSSNTGLPDEVLIVNIDGRHYNAVEEEDLLFFTQLQYLFAADNQLSLSFFTKLPKLKVLSLSLNSIDKIDINDKTFNELIALDLSYNKLSFDSFISIGKLPNLTDLDFTGNVINEITSSLQGLFLHLEKIVLDYNQIEDSKALLELSYLSSLVHCSCAYNFISLFPETIYHPHSFR
jgi:hypothetical protein